MKPQIAAFDRRLSATHDPAARSALMASFADTLATGGVADLAAYFKERSQSQLREPAVPGDADRPPDKEGIRARVQRFLHAMPAAQAAYVRLGYKGENSEHSEQAVAEVEATINQDVPLADRLLLKGLGVVVSASDLVSPYGANTLGVYEETKRTIKMFTTPLLARSTNAVAGSTRA